MSTAAAHEPRTLPPRVILFDGVCGVCNASIDWLLARDPEGKIAYAPLQGETAARLRAQHPEIPQDISMIVLVEREGDRERLSFRSEAAFRALAAIGSPLAAFRVLPRALTDFVYRIVAANRYRIGGRRDACRVPTPEERGRFLP